MRVTLFAFVATCLMVSPIGKSQLSADSSLVRIGQPIAGPMLDRASWYGSWHHGKTTANGEAFDMFDLTAAHKDLPFGTLVRVTDFDTGLSVVVRINDRGPYWADRSLDLSFGAAEQLGIIDQGLARVRIEILGRRHEEPTQVATQAAAAPHAG